MKKILVSLLLVFLLVSCGTPYEELSDKKQDEIDNFMIDIEFDYENDEEFAELFFNSFENEDSREEFFKLADKAHDDMINKLEDEFGGVDFSIFNEEHKKEKEELREMFEKGIGNMFKDAFDGVFN